MSKKVDILIRDGHVYDPASNIDYTGNLAVTDGYIEEHDASADVEAEHVIHASGCLVLPGLIDSHIHCFFNGTHIGLNPDIACIPAGVTAVIDAGSTGVSNCNALLDQLSLRTEKAKILLHVCAGGQIMSRQYSENVDPDVWDVGLFREILAKNRGRIAGLKIRTSKNIVGAFGFKPLEEAVRLGEDLGLRVVVHSTNPPGTMEEVAARLRPGDILCHVFHGNGESIISSDSVFSGIQKARERGVLFDLAQGQGNFSIPVAKKAIEAGFYPDTISTDLNLESWNNPLAFCLLMTMSKMRALGMPVRDIVKSVTANAAEVYGEAGNLGTLRKGTCGDITVVREKEMPVTYRDIYGNTVNGHVVFAPMLTVIDGKIQFRSPETI